MWSGWFRNESWNTCEKSLREREVYIYAWSSAWQIMTTRINWGSNILSTLILHMFLSPRWQPPTRPLSHWGKNSVAMVPQLKSWCWICLGALEQRGEWWKVGMDSLGQTSFFPIKLAPPRMEIQKFKSEAASAALGSEKVGQARTWFLLSCHCWIYHIKAYQSHFCVFCLKFLCPKNCSS